MVPNSLAVKFYWFSFLMIFTALLAPSPPPPDHTIDVVYAINQMINVEIICLCSFYVSMDLLKLKKIHYSNFSSPRIISAHPAIHHLKHFHTFLSILCEMCEPNIIISYKVFSTEKQIIRIYCSWWHSCCCCRIESPIKGYPITPSRCMELLSTYWIWICFICFKSIYKMRLQ